MNAPLVYAGLELKRALKRLPHVIAGAIVLVFFMGTVALLANRMLYGQQISGRIAVGVVIPEEKGLEKQAMSMISSLESVKSLCDFQYMDKEQAEKKLDRGEVYAVLEIPENLIQGIMNGTNPPVRVILSEAGVQGRIFKELTQGGARTLGAAQAGIYAGDRLLDEYGRSEARRQLEADLNRIYLSYSLPRMDYFKTVEVRATGDVDTLTFYGISGCVLILMLSGIPAASYLTPLRPVMEQKLKLLGIGRGIRTASRILGLGVLYLAAGLLMYGTAVCLGRMDPGLWQLLTLALVCLGAASVTVGIFQAAGSLMGGVMGLFVVTAAMHFGAGGFVPLVFLPEAVREASVFLPSSIFMDSVKMIAAGSFEPAAVIRLLAVTAAGFCLGAGAGGLREWRRAGEVEG